MDLKLILAKFVRRYLRWLLLEPKLFSFWEEGGFHITPVHFTSNVPDLRLLPDSIWQQSSELVGLDIKRDKQLQLLEIFESSYKLSYDAFPANKSAIPHEFFLNNGTFGSIDAEIAYCMVRHFKPQRIIEVGSGASTCVLAQSIVQNQRESSTYSCQLVSIDPYPSEIVKHGLPGHSELIQRQIQEMPLDFFRDLAENDILFIDSTHIAEIGSDVVFEFLEIIPRLKRGVLIHVHDVFLPASYPREWVHNEHWFWNEQYLLQAFLAFNSAFEVLWAGSFMRIQCPDDLKRAFASFGKFGHWPGSIWLRRVE